MDGIVGGDRMLEHSELAEAGQQGLAHAEPPCPATRRLRVIDDDSLHRMIICRAAAKAGYIAAAAASYEEAAELVRGNSFDCVTLDLSLGPHAGAEILRHLWVVGCKAPIVIISGCDDATCSETEKVAAWLKLNVWESIPKPVDLAVLRDCLERLRASREEAPTQQSAQVSPP
jgi:two-component system, chemotaxis family, chemotaxis protein CheY